MAMTPNQETYLLVSQSAKTTMLQMIQYQVNIETYRRHIKLLFIKMNLLYVFGPSSDEYKFIMHTG